MKDNWRYKLVPDFVLDKHLAYNPEDEMIAAIDGDVEDEPEYEWNYHDIIDYGVSKQRAHYIYKRACKKIRRAIDG